MLRIGFVDRWLDNWHTNHYPDYLRLASRLYGLPAEIVAAWAESDAPEGLTTDGWCAAHRVERAASVGELIAGVDAILVLCADDCLPHEALAHQALAGGKPVYCDKTFAPDLDAGARMFAHARAHGTPVFSCSAQRWCMELLAWQMNHPGPARHCATTGPGDMVNYSIHQFEMLEALLGTGASRCRALPDSDARRLQYQWEDGRSASFAQGQGLPFTLEVSATGAEGSTESLAVLEYYMNFMHALLTFFADGNPPVPAADTLAILAMQQAGRQALAQPGDWVELPVVVA